MIKKFRIKIHAYGHSADFTADALDSVQGVETAILDKIGKNAITWVANGFTEKGKCYVTYEEVKGDQQSSDSESIPTKKVSGA